MNRWLWFSVCSLLGLGLLVCGLLMPAHLRAIDASVLARAGREGPSLQEHGLALVQSQQLGSAQLLLLAAQREGLPDLQLAQALDEAARQHPVAAMWGTDAHLARVFESDANPPTPSKPEPFAEFMIRTQNRELVLGLLPASRKPWNSLA